MSHRRYPQERLLPWPPAEVRGSFLDTLLEAQFSMTHLSAQPGKAVRLCFWTVLFVLAGLGLYFMPSGNSANAQGVHVALAELDSPIDSVSAGYLSRAIERAQEDGAEALVVRVNTPGGTFDATIKMVEALSESAVPVVSLRLPGRRDGGFRRHVHRGSRACGRHGSRHFHRRCQPD